LHRNLNRPVVAAWILATVFFAAALSARAQDSHPDAANSVTTMITTTPVAQSSRTDFQPLAERRWEMGPFVNLGAGVGDRFGYYFFAPGFQLGKNLTPIVHAGPLTGRFEFGGNIMPLWQAYTPSPYRIAVPVSTLTPEGVEQVGGGTFTGLSITPVVFRWNFATGSRRFTPWFQAQGGVVYTTHKFPPTIEVLGGTSVWNFRSGAGIGFHYFTRPRRSLDFALNAEHLSSASLGDKNPGVNASLQFQLGYTWWK
jgi:lipid A 3-O-deacylase